MAAYTHNQSYASFQPPNVPYAYPPQPTGVYMYPTEYAPSHPTPVKEPLLGSVSSELQVAQERASRKRVVGRTLLIGAVIVFALLGMTAVLLTYICVAHQCIISSQAVTTTAPLGKVLTISQITSHTAPLSVPIVMGLCSYLLAATWLRSSTGGNQNRPSPMQ